MRARHFVSKRATRSPGPGLCTRFESLWSVQVLTWISVTFPSTLAVTHTHQPTKFLREMIYQSATSFKQRQIAGGRLFGFLFRRSQLFRFGSSQVNFYWHYLLANIHQSYSFLR